MMAKRWSPAMIVLGVVLLVGIWVVSVPVRTSVRDKARRAKAVAMMSAIDAGLKNYRTENGDYTRSANRCETVSMNGRTVASAVSQRFSG
jgi:hypothetical protein